MLAFAGIGHPEKFFATLADGGVDVRGAGAFADHHRYSPVEAADLIAQRRARGLVLVTTEKDLARLSGEARTRQRSRPLRRALPVSLVVEGAARRFARWCWPAG